MNLCRAEDWVGVVGRGADGVPCRAYLLLREFDAQALGQPGDDDPLLPRQPHQLQAPYAVHGARSANTVNLVLAHVTTCSHSPPQPPRVAIINLARWAIFFLIFLILFYKRPKSRTHVPKNTEC